MKTVKTVLLAGFMAISTLTHATNQVVSFTDMPHQTAVIEARLEIPARGQSTPLFEQSRQIIAATQGVADTFQGVANTFNQTVGNLAPVSDTMYRSTLVFTEGANRVYDATTNISQTMASLPEKATVCFFGGCVALTGLGLLYTAITGALGTSTTPKVSWKRNLLQGVTGSLFCVTGLAMALKSDAIVQKFK